jgi:hypothetical protein
MAYDDKIHRHDRQVKIMLNTGIFDDLRDVAVANGLQHSVLAREVIEAFLKAVEETGKLPLGLDQRKRA